MKTRPRLIIFASGTKNEGGSGFRELVHNNKTGVLKADIVAVVSNHKNGGVAQKAKKLKVPFEHFRKPYTLWGYAELIKKYNAKWVLLSGWLKLVPMRDYENGVDGLDPACVINIHPGPLPLFGGDDMYGKYVHKAVMEAYHRGKITESAVTMHFVTAKYDEGPVFFRYPVLIEEKDNADSLGARVNKIEHAWQSHITNLVIHGEISWDGKNPDSLKVPDNYTFL